MTIWKPRKRPDEDDGQGPVPAHLAPAARSAPETARRQLAPDPEPWADGEGPDDVKASEEAAAFAADPDPTDLDAPDDHDHEEEPMPRVPEVHCADTNADGTPCARPPWGESTDRLCYSHEMRRRRAAKSKPDPHQPPTRRPALATPTAPAPDANAAARTIRRASDRARAVATVAATRTTTADPPRPRPEPSASLAGTIDHLRAYIATLEDRRARIDHALPALRAALAALLETSDPHGEPPGPTPS